MGLTPKKEAEPAADNENFTHDVLHEPSVHHLGAGSETIGVDIGFETRRRLRATSIEREGHYRLRGKSIEGECQAQSVVCEPSLAVFQIPSRPTEVTEGFGLTSLVGIG